MSIARLVLLVVLVVPVVLVVLVLLVALVVARLSTLRPHVFRSPQSIVEMATISADDVQHSVLHFSVARRAVHTRWAVA